MKGGSKVEVPLTGWSTAATADWIVWPATGKTTTSATFPSRLASPTTQLAGPYTYATTNNGNALTLQVTIPARRWIGLVGSRPVVELARRHNRRIHPGRGLSVTSR